MNSCAQWLSWKCQMSSGTAREHVRVARALRDLPVIRSGFAAGPAVVCQGAGADPDRHPGHRGGAGRAGRADDREPAGAVRPGAPAGHRADDAAARVRRRLTWRFEEDGSLSGTFRLPPLQGAVLLKALRAACADLEHPHGDAGRFRGNARRGRAIRRVRPRTWPTRLVAVAESFLAAKVAGADDPDVYQVVVHVGTDALPTARRTPRRRRFRGNAPGRAADPGTRRTRPGATSRTARRSAPPPRRYSAAPPRCPGCARPGRRDPRPGPAPPPPTPRSAARPANETSAVAGSRAASPADRPAPHPVLEPRRPHRPGNAFSL